MNQRQLAEERAAKGVCIICEDGSTRITRGLCIKHHTRYMTSRRLIPEDRRGAYDDYLVSKGLLLMSRKGRRVDPNENEYALAAEEFLAGGIEPVDDAAQQLAEHMVNHASAEPPIEKAPKKGRAGNKKSRS